MKFDMKNYRSECSQCGKRDYVCCADLCENDVTKPGTGTVHNPVCPDCCSCDSDIARANVAACR